MPTVSVEHLKTISDLRSKIVVVGQGGKSTLSRALSKKLNLPYIELDAIHHLPNWRERSAEDFKNQIAIMLAKNPDGWIMDGNYFDVIAEGIESKEQERLLLENDFKFAQGFLYAKPMPLADALDWLTDHYRGPK